MLALSYICGLRCDIFFWLVEGICPLRMSFYGIEYVPLVCLVLILFVRAIDCLVLLGSDLHLLLGMMLPQEPYHMNPPFDPRLQFTTELLHHAGLLGLCPCQRQHSLR